MITGVLSTQDGGLETSMILFAKIVDWKKEICSHKCKKK